ncbi:MAG TPA: TadE family protein [Candidatus Limnocylindria bacterium]|nr:TadE family protein [Candidatus Limnocylindria bacterium]
MPFGRSERGQALVEFALLCPILLFLVVGLIEFSFVWNSRNTVMFASRDGSMLAAEGGNIDGTDCVVVQRVESDIVSPARAIRIQTIAIYWSDRNGAQIGSNQNIYTRTGSTTCDYPDGTSTTIPYTLTTGAYLEGSRCVTLGGCGGTHTTVDTIGVRVTYQHSWLTSFARLTGSGVTFTEASITRGEPQR